MLNAVWCRHTAERIKLCLRKADSASAKRGPEDLLRFTLKISVGIALVADVTLRSSMREMQNQ